VTIVAADKASGGIGLSRWPIQPDGGAGQRNARAVKKILSQFMLTNNILE
jgi:hypothetical protein